MGTFVAVGGSRSFVEDLMYMRLNGKRRGRVIEVRMNYLGRPLSIKVDWDR